jgi:hypothetical protein
MYQRSNCLDLWKQNFLLLQETAYKKVAIYNLFNETIKESVYKVSLEQVFPVG